MIESLADRIGREYNEEIAHWANVKAKGLIGRIRFNRQKRKKERMFPKGLTGFLPMAGALNGFYEYIAGME